VSLLYFYHLYVYSLLLSVSLPALANKVVHYITASSALQMVSTLTVCKHHGRCLSYWVIYADEAWITTIVSTL